MSSTAKNYVGVDVGTGSVRAALVSSEGRVVRTHSRELSIHNPRPDFYLQSSTQIWQLVGECVRQVTDGDLGNSVIGVGFDATCSLVVVDADGKGLR
jgi:ribulose kinase